MFDRHLNSSRRSSFFAHGPERAYAIPIDKPDALAEAVSFASEVWNGAGSLILLVDEDGTIDPRCEAHIPTRHIDETWLHPELTPTATAVLRRRSGLEAIDWADPFQFPDFHPTQLLRSGALGERWPMTLPEFSDASQALQAYVLWGRFRDGRLWSDRFDLGVTRDGNAYLALLGGQLGLSELSPLRVSQLSMPVFGQRGDAQPCPYLWVFDPNPSIDDLVDFWNYRSSADATNTLASVVGIPAEALDEPAQLDAIIVWARQTGSNVNPSLLVTASDGLRGTVTELLDGQGFVRVALNDPRPDVESDSGIATTFAFTDMPIARGRITRGAWDWVDFQIRGGTALMMLPKPRGLVPSGGARLAVQDVPTPLPLTQTIARHLDDGCYARAGALGVNIVTGSPWGLSLQVPSEAEALKLWAEEYGYTTAETEPAKDARALIGRLGDLTGLDTLLDEVGLEILVALAPTAQERFARRLAGLWTPEGTDPKDVADAIRDKLRTEGLLVQSDARTVEQLGSILPGIPRRGLIEGLAGVVKNGLVVRGRNLKCPRCGFNEFRQLRELDEHIVCRGCGISYLLPVVDPNHDEARLAYRVDALTARVLERHVLPVVLTIRALRWHPRGGAGFDYCWPGVLFSREDEKDTDVDMLLSDGARVFAAECKLDARGLETEQLDKLILFARRTDAIPVVAALVGDFDQAVAERLVSHQGLVLTRADLVASHHQGA